MLCLRISCNFPVLVNKKIETALTIKKLFSSLLPIGVKAEQNFAPPITLVENPNRASSLELNTLVKFSATAFQTNSTKHNIFKRY